MSGLQGAYPTSDSSPVGRVSCAFTVTVSVQELILVLSPAVHGSESTTCKGRTEGGN